MIDVPFDPIWFQFSSPAKERSKSQQELNRLVSIVFSFPIGPSFNLTSLVLDD